MKKKNSAMKKLIPATSMLLVSATMLATSTYAWFTMSKEVSVTGIKMTASVPENLEISLGDGQKAGQLVAETGSQVNATNIANPGDDDWSNTVAVSDYYRFGYIIPASSTTGLDIFYTPNANEAGVNVTENAQFTQADTALAAGMTSFSVTQSDFAAWDPEEHTKGYYIDIPVWFRTSSTDDLELKVQATIIDGGSNGTLYNAARASILKSGSTNNTDTQKVLVDKNYDVSTAGKYYDRYTSLTGLTTKKNLAVKAAGTFDGTPASGNTAASPATAATVAGIYDETSFVTQASANATTPANFDGDTVVTVTAAANAQEYSTPVQYTIRVWLEGEDVNCWDATAGQDFTIDLRFVREEAPAAVTAANSP